MAQVQSCSCFWVSACAPLFFFWDVLFPSDTRSFALLIVLYQSGLFPSSTREILFSAFHFLRLKTLPFCSETTNHHHHYHHHYHHHHYHLRTHSLIKYYSSKHFFDLLFVSALSLIN